MNEYERKIHRLINEDLYSDNDEIHAILETELLEVLGESIDEADEQVEDEEYDEEKKYK